MRENIAYSLVQQWKGKVSYGGIGKIMKEIQTLPEDCQNALSNIELKSKWVGFFISCIGGIFAVDRFYKGDKKLAIFKFILNMQIFLLIFLAPLLVPSFLPIIKGFIAGFWSSGISGIVSFGTSLVNISESFSMILLLVKIIAYFIAFWFCLMIFGFLWTLIDPFLVFFGIKRDNLRKILSTIIELKK